MKHVLLAALLAAGCGPRIGPAWPTAAPTLDEGWRTMRAQHEATIDVDVQGGHEVRHLRAVLAVERPDRLRLRALGPGGVALFDLLYRGGEVKVISSLRDAKSGSLSRIAASMGGDLAAAFGLTPSQRRIAGSEVVLEQPERTVRLSDFQMVGGHAVPLRISVDNRALHYHVAVKVGDVSLDEPLDPALFAP